jgi:hypothetical protein
LLALPAFSMLETRTRLRRDLHALFDALGENTYAQMTDAWFSQQTQGTLHALVQRLKHGKAR